MAVLFRVGGAGAGRMVRHVIQCPADHDRSGTPSTLVAGW